MLQTDVFYQTKFPSVTSFASVPNLGLSQRLRSNEITGMFNL